MNTMTTRMALAVILDQIDYTKGACSPTEMVGAAVSRQVLKDAREALDFEMDSVVDRWRPNKLRQLPKSIKLRTGKIP